MSQNGVPGWKRMRFKGNKVWMEVDDTGQPAVSGSKVRIKYQLDQPHEYRVNPNSLSDLAAEPAGNRGKKAKSAPAGKTRTKTAKSDEKSAETASDRDAVIIFTDGAASGNPGPAGIGAVLRYRGQQKEISRYIGTATNNIAELEAVRAALSALKKKDLPVRVYTDSSYVHGLLVLGWKAKKNPELVDALRQLVNRFTDIEIIKVRGHGGVADNERADSLAVSAIKNRGAAT